MMGYFLAGLAGAYVNGFLFVLFLSDDTWAPAALRATVWLIIFAYYLVQP